MVTYRGLEEQGGKMSGRIGKTSGHRHLGEPKGKWQGKAHTYP